MARRSKTGIARGKRDRKLGTEWKLKGIHRESENRRTRLSKNRIPTAPLVAVTPLPDGIGGTVWALDVWCPYCRRIHRHGGGTDPERITEFLGHRVQHCSDPALKKVGLDRNDPRLRGYDLTDPDGVLANALKRKPRVSA